MTIPELKLRRCDVAQCHGLCCYDGVYLLDGEELLLREVVRRYPDQFPGLPADFLIEFTDRKKITWWKTAIRPHEYPAGTLPAHFTATRCVFADEKTHYCQLQSLAMRLGVHRWTFKPSACWLCPLKVDEGEILLPPEPGELDHDYEDAEHPGYTSFLPCGHHDPAGEPWYDVLDQELEYYETFDFLPVWDLRRQSFEEILEQARLNP